MIASRRLVIHLVIFCILAGFSGDSFAGLLNAPERLWMISHERAVVWSGEDLHLLDATKGEVKQLLSARYAALSADRKTLLIARTDHQKDTSELALYDLTTWPPTLQLQSQIGVLVWGIVPTGLPQQQFAVWWMAAYDSNSLPLLAISSLGSTKDRTGKLRFYFEPIPSLSGNAVSIQDGLLFCPARPYMCAADGYLSESAKQVLPRSALLGKQIPAESLTGTKTPWGVSGQLIMILDGKKLWARADADRPVAFSNDGKRLLARLFTDFMEPATWCLFDTDTGKYHVCEYIPTDMGSILAVGPNLATGIARQKFGLYFVAKGAKPKALVHYPEAKFEMPPSPPDSATDEQRQKWLDEVNEREAKVAQAVPRIAADYFDKRFYVFDGSRLHTISEIGQMLAQQAISPGD